MTEVKKGYSKSKNRVGLIASVNYITQKYTLVSSGIVDEFEEFEESIDDIEVYDKIFDYDGQTIYHNDVFINNDGEKVLFELDDDIGLVVHSLIDMYTSKVSVKYASHLDCLKEMSSTLTFVGSLEVLRSQVPDKPDFSFNIKVVKETAGKEDYYYACNDKKGKRIDLIKVVFIGHNLLKESEYSRVTLSYEGFQELIEGSNKLEEVSPASLGSYAINKVSKAHEAEDLKIGIEESACCKTGDTCTCGLYESVTEESEKCVDPTEDVAEHITVHRNDFDTCGVCYDDIDDCKCLWDLN